MEKNFMDMDVERTAEVASKRKQIADFLLAKGMDAVLISRHENIAWATAGVVDVRVGVLRESGAASLLVTREGGAFYLTTNNEAARMAEEEFLGLGYEPVVNPWFGNDVPASIGNIVGFGKVASDMPQFGYEVLPMQSLRYELTEGEIARYRWLGSHAATVATAVLRRAQPGMSERTFQAMLAEQLLGQGIMPSTYLTAVDRRALGYSHAVPRAGVLERLGMLGFCARRWGLSVSMTRFVQFGAAVAEFDERMSVVAQVNARLQGATREGTTSDELFRVAEEAYAALGCGGEEKMHHQGGATGYLEREWVARPGGGERVTSQQAFAWNPNLKGAKVEDTVLLHHGAIELLTATPELPVVNTAWDGRKYLSAGVLKS